MYMYLIQLLLMSASFPKMMPPLNINRPQMLATENEQWTAHVYMYFYNLYVRSPFPVLECHGWHQGCFWGLFVSQWWVITSMCWTARQATESRLQTPTGPLWCVSPCRWPVNAQQLPKKLSRLFTWTEGVMSGPKGPMGVGEGGGVAV